jgi:hypothetical protein
VIERGAGPSRYPVAGHENVQQDLILDPLSENQAFTSATNDISSCGFRLAHTATF